MVNESLNELRSFERTKQVTRQYHGPVQYNVQGKRYDVPPWNHPATLANKILSWVSHTYFYGVMIVGPPGHGKTSVATSLAHQIHKKDPRFMVKWADAHDFTHQEQLFKSLPKYPHIIIFDDVSSVMKQISEKQVAKNFEALTKVRWHLDPARGKIPVIIIVDFHYSKNLEKEIRAQLGMTIFVSFGNEERTNLDTIAEKHSKAYYLLKDYAKLYTEQFDKHEFELPMPTGTPMKFATDNPFRAVCAISRTDAKIIVYSDKDCCEVCSQKRFKRIVPPEQIYEQIKTAYGAYGVQALRHALYRRGYDQAVHPSVASASDMIEQKIFSHFDTDMDKLMRYTWTADRKKVPDRRYRKRKQEDEMTRELKENSVEVEIQPEPQSKSTDESST